MIEENTTIELATHSDAPGIAMLSRDLIEQGLGWRWNSKKVIRAINDGSTNVVVAKKGRILAGFGIMIYGDEKANLDLLAVKHRFHRNGIGTGIVRWLEQVAGSAGIFHIYVQLREKNAIAENFYSRLGFEIVDVVPNFYRRIESSVIMYKYTGLVENVM